jgi:hypothetical protein
MEEKISADARVSGLGFIIVDEIQNLKMLNDNLAAEVLAAFTRLNEMSGIPLILLGTQDVALGLKALMHSARRAAGSEQWKTMGPGKEWDDWLREVLTKGVVKKALPFTKATSEYFYEYSQGIAHAAVALFYKAQEIVLDSGRDEIRESDLEAAKTKLYLMDNRLAEVRALRQEKLAKHQIEAEKQAKLTKKSNKGQPTDPTPDFAKAAGK